MMGAKCAQLRPGWVITHDTDEQVRIELVDAPWNTPPVSVRVWRAPESFGSTLTANLGQSLSFPSFFYRLEALVGPDRVVETHANQPSLLILKLLQLSWQSYADFLNLHEEFCLGRMEEAL